MSTAIPEEPLFIAERKTVCDINREFAVTTGQSCLNRLLTEAPWDAQALNDRRLALFQQDPQTRYRQDGVIAIDNTLIDHTGTPNDQVYLLLKGS
jgi:hypothetical protein